MIAESISELFDLLRAGDDEFVGIGHEYPWGGLYGGHIVAQALRAAGLTVDPELLPHSLRAYFIRRGEHKEVVRYEVDRLRNGKSFATRRVVAKQTGGAILNLEASFQRPEPSDDVTTIPIAQNLPSPDLLFTDSWTKLFDSRWIDVTKVSGRTPDGSGRLMAWMKAANNLGDDPLIQACALAYLSDYLPTKASILAHPQLSLLKKNGVELFTASLDHTMWFHRLGRIDEWHLHDISCHNFTGGRGLAIGHVHGADGVHIATIAQESLVRPPHDN